MQFEYFGLKIDPKIETFRAYADRYQMSGASDIVAVSTMSRSTFWPLTSLFGRDVIGAFDLSSKSGLNKSYLCGIMVGLNIELMRYTSVMNYQARFKSEGYEKSSKTLTVEVAKTFAVSTVAARNADMAVTFEARIGKLRQYTIDTAWLEWQKLHRAILRKIKEKKPVLQPDELDNIPRFDDPFVVKLDGFGDGFGDDVREDVLGNAEEKTTRTPYGDQDFGVKRFRKE